MKEIIYYEPIKTFVLVLSGPTGYDNNWTQIAYVGTDILEAKKIGIKKMFPNPLPWGEVGIDSAWIETWEDGISKDSNDIEITLKTKQEIESIEEAERLNNLLK